MYIFLSWSLLIRKLKGLLLFDVDHFWFLSIKHTNILLTLLINCKQHIDYEWQRLRNQCSQKKNSSFEITSIPCLFRPGWFTIYAFCLAFCLIISHVPIQHKTNNFTVRTTNKKLDTFCSRLEHILHSAAHYCKIVAFNAPRGGKHMQKMCVQSSTKSFQIFNEFVCEHTVRHSALVHTHTPILC